MASARLQITIESASNLYNADGILAGKSDPYVIVEVPGQETMKFETPVINNDLNPVWNHTGEIAGFMDGDVLQFTVMDKDTWPKPDNLLGKVSLDASDFYPNGFAAAMALEESNTAATLTVMISILGCEEPGMETNQLQAGMPVEEGGMMMAPEGGGSEPYPGTVVMAGPTSTYSAPSVPGQACYSGAPATYSSFPTTQTMSYGAPQMASPRVSQPSMTYSAPQPSMTYSAPQPSMTYSAPGFPATGQMMQAGSTSMMGQPPMTYSSPGSQTGKVTQVIVHEPVTVSAQEFAQTDGTIVSTPLPVTTGRKILDTVERAVGIDPVKRSKKKSRGCC